MAEDLIASLGGVVHDQPAETQPAAAASGGDDVIGSLGGVVHDQPTDAASAEPEQASDFGGAVKRGLKNLAPFLLTKEDIQHKSTLGETAAEVATTIAGDVATSAGVGALAGSIVPGAGTAVGAAAGALLGAVRGFGYEYARSKAEGQDFNPVRGVVNSLAEINPLVGKGGRLMKAATQGVLEVARSAQYGGDKQNNEIAGVVGAVAGGLFHQNTGEWIANLGAVASKPSSVTQRAGLLPGEAEGALQMFADTSSTRMGERIENAVAKVEQADPTYFKLGDKLKSTEPEVQADVDGFKKWIADKPGMRANDDEIVGKFDHYTNTVGQDTVAADYATYKKQQVALKQIDQFNNEVATDLLFRNKETGEIKPKTELAGAEDFAKHERVAPPEDPLQGKWVDKMRDVKFVGRQMDQVAGTNIEGTIDSFSAAKNRQGVVMSTYMERANELTKAGRKADLDNETVGRWLALDDINSNRRSLGQKELTIELTPQQQKVADGWRSLFEDTRLRLKNEGLNIDFLDGQTFAEGGKYLPMKGKLGADAVTSMRREASRLEAKYGPDFLQHGESTDLRRAVGKLVGKDPEDVKYVSDVTTAQRLALDPSKQKLMQGYEANATFQREVGLGAPEFIRDFDVGKLFVNYMNNSFKSVFYHDPLIQLSTQLDMLSGMGFKNSAQYLQKYIDDVSGKQSNFLAGLTYQTNRHKATLQKMIDDVDPESFGSTAKQGALKAVRDAPDLAAFAISSIYPNYLGLNVKAALRNYAQPMLMTAPELGWDYGGKLVAKATAQAAWDKLKGGVDFVKALKARSLDVFANDLEHTLQQKGLAPGKHFGIAGDVTDQGLRSVKGVGRAIEGLDKFNQVAMGLYSTSDTVNRYVTLKVAENLVKDLKGGNQRALDYVTRTMSEGNKAAFRQLGVRTAADLAKADEGKLSDLLAQQLIAKTQFNYGKEAMNEYGRHFGRLASMFTKWPAMMYSDSSELLQKFGNVQGSAKIVQKYLAPAAALMLVGQHLLDTENNPTQKYLLGSNLADWAPVQSWKVGTPPVFTTAAEASKTLLDMFASDKDSDQKLGELKKFGTKQALSYLPGMTFFNERARWRRAHGLED